MNALVLARLLIAADTLGLLVWTVVEAMGMVG